METQTDLPIVSQDIKPVVPSAQRVASVLLGPEPGLQAAIRCRHGTATLSRWQWAFLPRVLCQDYYRERFPLQLGWVYGPPATSSRRGGDLPEAGDATPGLAAAASGNLLLWDVRGSLRALEISEGLAFLVLLNSKAYLYSNWVKE